MERASGTIRRISSKATCFYKRGFTVMWFGLMLLGAAAVLFASHSRGLPPRALPGLVILVVVWSFAGVLIFKTITRNLVDEVYDGGEYLIVRNKGEEEMVPLTHVMNVSAELMNKPPRVTLRLVKPGRFGRDISFLAERPSSFRWPPLVPIVDDLIERVDRARTRRVT